MLFVYVLLVLFDVNVVYVVVVAVFAVFGAWFGLVLAFRAQTVPKNVPRNVPGICPMMCPRAGLAGSSVRGQHAIHLSNGAT